MASENSKNVSCDKLLGIGHVFCGVLSTKFLLLDRHCGSELLSMCCSLSFLHPEALVFLGKLSEHEVMLLLILHLMVLPCVPGPHGRKGKRPSCFQRQLLFPSGTRGPVERARIQACSCEVLIMGVAVAREPGKGSPQIPMVVWRQPVCVPRSVGCTR